ncbi:NUDIX hydrolase [Lutimaribacter sp. EGI FJ00015]|uniref:NUDIX hydrolase n=1 Tax=Lutimaribacter degradans TaxID=2945989 RepID=A0ACC5ZWM6_9RHOB|nr:NUDIX hydrolase [Lutimaribacter sp. EGI FJ00013]MCM2561954.1 NUDIX hydrolase [Lutimaribacter sp. EGI FJ00013]MCO0613014.1 NUDIX hydrolase [Lutimaribacter sp. EGI FJ00015]MCO0635786.1 NUDIX hydrolase [Lutimaribacter sp. EGI FJ00014]
MIPRFGPTPRHDVKYRLRPGAYAILPRGEELLLTFQAQPRPELQLPGGGIDPGESPLAALHREVFEETGWTIAAPRRLGAFRRFVYMPEYDLWAEKLCVIYHARPVRRIGPPTEPDHRDVWVSSHRAAQELGNSGDRHFVTRFVA